MSSPAAQMPPCRITEGPILSDSMMSRFAARAPGYDRENQFFTEDFQELRQGGIPADGGAEGVRRGGMTLAEVVREQRRLATTRRRRRSRPTCTCTGPASRPTFAVPATILVWLLEEAAARRGVRGRARRTWQRHPVVALDDQGREGRRRLQASPATRCSAPSHRCGPVSASTGWTRATRRTRRSCTRSCPVMPRAIASKRHWDMLGMRATRSDDTILDGAFVPDKYIVRVVPAGRGGQDAFVLGVFAWALHVRQTSITDSRDVRST